MKGSLRSDSDRDEDNPDLIGLARIPTQAGAQTFCRTCRQPAPERLVRVVGAWSVIEGVAVWDCKTCARERILEIESGSDVRRNT
jgi:hypothetical protein